LESGSYGSTSAVHRLTNSGSSGGQITITSAPGETPKIVGLLEAPAEETESQFLHGASLDGGELVGVVDVARVFGALEREGA